MKFSATFAAAASLFAGVHAHGGVDTYTVGNTVYQGWSPYNSASGQKSIQRQYPSYDPLFIKDLSTVNIRCNNAGAKGTGVSGTIAAGQKLKAHWKQWTHRPAAIMIYIAKCPSSGCDSWDGSGKVWAKLFHEGLVSGTANSGIWAGDAIVDTLEWTVTIPESLVAGDYLIRHELLALHQANNPQFYPECAQFTITGSGTASPPSSLLVAFPGAYSGTEPGVAFNIDSDASKAATTYAIPGPAVWDPSSPSTSPNGTSSAAPEEPATTAAPEPTTLVTSAAPPKTTAPSCGPVAKYGQCGGKTFTGCTVCDAGLTCNSGGEYYSQCV